jgi:ABC-2 type transport system permease protein
MKVLTITYYTFLRHIRDVKAMAAFILLPIIMMLILGAALDNAFTPKKVEKMNVGYLSVDEGILRTSMEQFLHSKDMGTLLRIKKVANVNEGKELVRSGKLKALIYLSKSLSSKLQKGKQAQIEFYTKDENSYVQPVLESFVRTYNLGNTLVKINGKPFETKQMSANINEVKIVTKGKIPRGIDYYAIATLFQSLLFGAVFGVFAITKDIGNHTYLRMYATPVEGIKVTLGKLLGSTITLYGISLFIFVITKFIFKANWNASLWLILLVLFLFSAISIAFGMILAFLTKSTMISSLTMFIVSTVLTLVAGGFSRMEGKVVDVLSHFSPNTYSQKALFTNIYDGKVVYSSILDLVLYTGVAILVTFILGRRRVI